MSESTRRITAGRGLNFGRSDSAVSIELSPEVREEILALRSHFIDTEQLLALHTWKAVNPEGDPHPHLAEWKVQGIEKWGRQNPSLSALLFPEG